jgi:hypothetical protein
MLQNDPKRPVMEECLVAERQLSSRPPLIGVGCETSLALSRPTKLLDLRRAVDAGLSPPSRHEGGIYRASEMPTITV